jgi:hypothetical protein
MMVALVTDMMVALVADDTVGPRPLACRSYGGPVIWFEAFWQLVSVLTAAGPTGLLVGTGAVAGLLLIVALSAGVLWGRRPTGADSRDAGRTLRQQAARTGVPRHRDPDASGRIRPRGPTRAFAAA